MPELVTSSGEVSSSTSQLSECSGLDPLSISAHPNSRSMQQHLPQPQQSLEIYNGLKMGTNFII